jgi:UDP-N-acetylglucosamine--N-acetylmuramyl-(pentapeptide) pyrophosphoryl-undecaprenol N-acetylglucosamine transferase
MRVVFCGGGTGGHVYPALTVAAALKRRYGDGQPLDLLYLGVKGKIDRDLVEREGIPFQAITAGPLRVGSIKGVVQGGARLTAGTAQAYSILGRWRPDAVFATGGYGSAGAGLAARARGLPLILFEPGPESGLAVKMLSRAATKVIVTIPPALDHMPRDKTELIGYPVRPAFFEARRDSARQQLGLEPNLPTLLVSGASSGASRLNEALASWSAGFLRIGQLIHISGPRDEPWLRALRDGLPEEQRSRYHLHAYLHEEMPLAMTAADLAVMRSGASVLGELPATGLPAVLVPGEYEGWDQSANARYLEEQGAAVMLRQHSIDRLQPLVMELLGDTSRREAMKENLAALARPTAAEDIADVIAQTAGVTLPKVAA